MMSVIELFSLKGAVEKCKSLQLAQGLIGNYCGSKSTIFEIDNIYPQSVDIYVKENPSEQLLFRNAIDMGKYIVVVNFRLLELFRDEIVESEYSELLDYFEDPLGTTLENIIDRSLEMLSSYHYDTDFELKLLSTPVPYQIYMPLIKQYEMLIGDKLLYKEKGLKGYALIQSIHVETSKDSMSMLYCKVWHSRTKETEYIPLVDLFLKTKEKSWDTIEKPLRRFLIETGILFLTKAYNELLKTQWNESE